MSKSSKKHSKYDKGPKLSKVADALPPYGVAKKIPASTDLSFAAFKKIAASMPFTLSEWAHILHLSERTLQRYSKNSSDFEGIYADRIRHIDQLIHKGLQVFQDAPAFYGWLHKEKKALGYILDFEALYSTQGIQYIIDQLSRIEQGVYT